MILKTLSMGKQPVYYVQKSYRNEDGKPSTKYVERLGTLEDLEKRFGREDPIGEAKKYVAELTAQEKENRKKIILECNPAVLIDKNAQRCYNGGYLFLQKSVSRTGSGQDMQKDREAPQEQVRPGRNTSDAALHKDTLSWFQAVVARGCKAIYRTTESRHSSSIQGVVHPRGRKRRHPGGRIQAQSETWQAAR